MRALNACAAGVVVLVAVGLPGGALGKGLPPGVHVDPGSPAGKEYQIPVASARSLSAGQKDGSSGANPPLFGVGVTSARAHSSTTTTAGAAAGGGFGTTAGSGSRTTTAGAAAGGGFGTTAGSGSRTTTAGAAAGGGFGTTAGSGSRTTAGRSAHRRGHRRRSASTGSLPTASRSTRADAAQPGGESWLPLVAGGALVLVVGGGGGLGLRRRYLQT